MGYKNDVILFRGKCEISRKQHTYPICSLSFSPDGQKIAAGYHDGAIKIWHFIDGQGNFIDDKIDTFLGHKYPVTVLTFSPDNTRLASASAAFGENGAISLTNIETKKKFVLFEEEAKCGDIRSIEFSPDGRSLAAIGDGYTNYFDLTNYSFKYTSYGSNFNCLQVEGYTHIAFTEGGISLQNRNKYDFDKISEYINNDLKVDQALVILLQRVAKISERKNAGRFAG